MRPRRALRGTVTTEPPKRTSEKTTVALDQFAILRGLLDRAAAKSDALDAKFDRLAERMEAGVQGLRTELSQIKGELAALEARIDELENKDAALERQQSDASLEHEAAVGVTLGKVARLELALEQTNEALAVVVEELGVADRTKLGSTPPPDKDGNVVKPRPALQQIEHSNKRQNGLLVVALFLQVLLEVLRHVF